MKEAYVTRREAAAEQVEQSERYKAIECLRQLGIFQKVSDLELYHGRSNTSGEEWQLKADFDNSGDNTGNANINKRPALNTGTRDVAERFSQARARRGGGKAEIHRIESEDPDAMIIDVSAFKKIKDKEDIAAARTAFATLTPGAITGAPLPFEKRHALDHVHPKAFFHSDDYPIMYAGEEDRVCRKTGLDKATVEHAGSALNTQTLFKNGSFLRSLCLAFCDAEDSVSVSCEGKYREAPINHEYIANWLRTNHIVGCKMPVWSATLGEDIDNYLMFDLEKVNTPEAYEKRSEERNKAFGKIATSTAEKLPANKSSLVETLATDLYIKPEKIVELAKQTEGFKEILESDAGNHEGYRLDEHTETVLRLFDENYADALPAHLLPVMRMALLVHDIGKSVAVKNNDKRNQKKYNLAYAKRFMALNEVDDQTSNLILSMIGDGMELTWGHVSDRNNREKRLKLWNYCGKMAADYLGKSSVSAEEVHGFELLLSVLQTCDSAAYTTMAVTKPSRRGISYRNQGVFNGSFSRFHGFTGRRIRFH